MAAFVSSSRIWMWAQDLEHILSDSTERFLTTNNVRLIGIVGGYLLLRPYLQQLLGVFPAAEYEQLCSADGPLDASMPEAMSPN